MIINLDPPYVRDFDIAREMRNEFPDLTTSTATINISLFSTNGFRHFNQASRKTVFNNA